MAHFVVERPGSKPLVFVTESKARHAAKAFGVEVKVFGPKPNPYTVARAEIRSILDGLNGQQVRSLAKQYGVKANVKSDLLRTGIEQAHMASVSARLRAEATA